MDITNVLRECCEKLKAHPEYTGGNETVIDDLDVKLISVLNELNRQQLAEQTPEAGKPHTIVRGPIHVVCQCDQCKTKPSVEVLEGVTNEYNAWILFHNAGNGDYSDFIATYSKPITAEDK